MTNSTNGIARNWRLKAQRYRLIGQICPDCRRRSLQPRPVCPYCVQVAEPLFTFVADEAAIAITPNAISIKLAA